MADIVKTRRWEQKRLKILRRDGYMDQYLFRTKGIMRNANIVHHILPKEKFPQYQWEDWNLMSVTWDTHLKILHNRNGDLTKAGRQLMLETAYMNGVKLNTTTLVIGLPNSGKTTYVQRHLGEGLAYDLDYIAAAFRLKKPHEEEHESARTMANRLLKGFIVEAPKYNSEVFIIRTAPYEDELYAIRPDRLVICDGGKADFDTTEVKQRIKFCEEYCSANNVEVEHYKKSLSQ